MLRKQIQLLFSPLGILAAVLLTSGLAVGVYKVAAHRSPGPLTAVHSQNEPLGGYAAHAEFEQECQHCHAPVHCITEDRCQSCHIEIAEQRVEAIGLHGILPGTSECQSCHIEHQGRDAQITVFAFKNVDHEALAGFSLVNHQTNYDGEPIDCHSCHQLGDYGAEALDCIDCHTNEDAAFTTTHITYYGTDCASCHDGHTQLANFDHNQIFPLEGQHANAACETCHVNQVFKGTPQACVACHEQPDIHDGSFGDDCARCHTATAWSPAELRYHSFPLDHGTDGQQECQVCHATSYTHYPCEACHETAETRSAHTEEYTQETYENCLACHPDGRIAEADEMQASNPGMTGAIMQFEP
jgi:hypothetical protein